MSPEKNDHEMLAEIYQLMLGRGGCWDREAKVTKDFYAFRLSVIVAGALLFGGTGFGFAKIIEFVGH